MRSIKAEKMHQAAVKIASVVRMMLVRAHLQSLLEDKDVELIFGGLPSAPPTRPGTGTRSINALVEISFEADADSDANAGATAATAARQAADRLERQSAKPERGREDPLANIELEVVDALIEMIETLAGGDTISEQAKLQRALGLAPGGDISL